MKRQKYSRIRAATLVALLLSLAAPPPVHAQFGGGTQIVFDPQMFARQLQQLQQETQSVVTLAQQLQYMIKNTTGGGAGVWQTNEGFLTNLGNLINEQEGLSYSVQGLTQQFQQLYPGFNTVSTAGVQSPQATIETYPEYPERRSRVRTGTGSEFPG